MVFISPFCEIGFCSWPWFGFICTVAREIFFPSLIWQEFGGFFFSHFLIVYQNLSTRISQKAFCHNSQVPHTSVTFSLIFLMSSFHDYIYWLFLWGTRIGQFNLIFKMICRYVLVQRFYCLFGVLYCRWRPFWIRRILLWMNYLMRMKLFRNAKLLTVAL